MLAHSLAVVRAVRPDLPIFARAVVEAICLTEGPIGSAQEVARHLGLANRFQLARLLKHEGLPPLHRLAEWATLESWVLTAERDGVSLCHIAFRSKRHPSACYRLVKELIGLGAERVLEPVAALRLSVQGRQCAIEEWTRRTFSASRTLKWISRAPVTRTKSATFSALIPPPGITSIRCFACATRLRICAAPWGAVAAPPDVS